MLIIIYVHHSEKVCANNNRRLLLAVCIYLRFIENIIFPRDIIQRADIITYCNFIARGQQVKKNDVTYLYARIRGPSAAVENSRFLN